MNRSRSAVLACLALASLCAPQGAISTAAAQPCEPAWAKEFPSQNPGAIRCFLPVEEDGQTVYYLAAGDVIRWDGKKFSKLGDGLDSVGEVQVWALTQFDDGAGPAIYAAGAFDLAGGVPAVNIAKWDGRKWSPLGPGLWGLVRALQAWDDGTGPALYAAGFFKPTEQQPGWRIAKWDGKKWSALGTGLSEDGTARALTVYTVDGREQLVLGGHFTEVGGVAAWDIAAWDGRKWSAFGPPLGDGPFDNHTVTRFGLIDLGAGPSLYVLGAFGLKSNPDLRNIARWTGQTWEPVGHGVGGPSDFLSSITSFDPGDDPRLVVGGDIPGGYSVWDGASWQAGNIFSQYSVIVRSLQPFEAATGPELLMGGEGVCARWNGSALRWGLAPGGPSGPYIGGSRSSLARLPMADGARMFISGQFHSAGDVQVNGCASYGVDGWRATGVTDGDRIEYVAAFDDGMGPAMYGTGSFPSLDNNNQSRLAKWNGATWDLVTAEPIKGPLFVHDDGSGTALYMASVTSPPVICRWDGAALTKLPAALSEGEVRDFVTFEDASGPSLIVAGSFQQVDGNPAGGIARWDGAAWHTIDGNPPQRTISAVTVHNFGFGPMLCVASNELNQAGKPIMRVARWNGAAWITLGGNFVPPEASVHDLVSFYDGSSTALFATGNFVGANNKPVAFLARWNGLSWSEPFGGIPREGHAMVPIQSVSEQSLWISGEFSTVGDGVSSRTIARWDTCPSCAPDFDKSDTLDIDDFIAFQSAFGAGDPRADFTGDGELDTDDFLAFSVAFGAGCP